MIACEDCGDDVEHVFRHRAYGVTMTHRVTTWLCRDCHPTVPTRRASPSETGTTGSSGTVVTDGGVSAACPDCSSTTVNVHGVRDCTECGWHAC